MGECLSHDTAMANREMRPRLVEAYDGLVSTAFNDHLYTEKEGYISMSPSEVVKMSRQGKYTGRVS